MIDADSAHIVGGQCGDVHDQSDHWHHGGHKLVGMHGDFQHFLIFSVVALFLIVCANKGADDPNAGKLLTEHLIENVNLSLLLFKPRVGLFCGDDDHHCNDRHYKQQDYRQLDVLPEAHDDAAQQKDRRGDDGAQKHLHHLLDLVDIVGGAGDQGRGAEFIQIGLGKGLYLGKQPQPHIPPIGQRGFGGEIGSAQRADAHQNGHQQHQRTVEKNLPHIAGHYAVINDLGVQRRKIQVGKRLEGDEYNCKQHPLPVWLDISEKCFQWDHSLRGGSGRSSRMPRIFCPSRDSRSSMCWSSSGLKF